MSCGRIQAGVTMEPLKSYVCTKYEQTEANTTCCCTGVILPDGEQHALYRFRANGAEPSAYVSLIWDYQGVDEKIIASTKGDVDLFFDISVHTEHLEGDGVKKLEVIITNDNDEQTPIIGGSFELVKVS